MAYVFNPFTGTLDNTGAGGGGGVDDVSNVDGTLTISPTTGSVVASLNLSNANSWVGKQTFTTTAPRFSTLTTNGGIFYGNASGDLQQTGAGTATQVLHGGTSPTYGAVVLTTDVSGILPVANGGTGTSTAFTTGSVIFQGASGYSEDNANLFWDDTNNYLSIGTASNYTSKLNILIGAATDRGAVIKLHASQSANAWEIQPSASSTPVAYFSKDGYLNIANTVASTALTTDTQVGGGSTTPIVLFKNFATNRFGLDAYGNIYPGDTASGGLNSNFGNSRASLCFTNTTRDKIYLYMGSPTTADRWGFGVQSWTFVMFMDPGNPGTGKFSWRNSSTATDASSGTEVMNLYTTGTLEQILNTTTAKGHTIKLAAAHTATAWEVQSSTGTKLLAAEPGLIDPFGNVRDMAITFGANVGLFYTTADAIDFRINGGVSARGLRVISASVIGTNDTFFQAACTASGYGCFEGYNGAGTAILTYPDTPILFCPNRVEKMRLTSTTLTLADAINIAVNTTTGTKIGTATTQKLAFFNSTPIVQPANTVSLETVLSNLGLRASGTSAPLAIGNLTIADGSNIIFDTTTGTKIGTATTQKLAFFNSTPIVQPANSVSLETVLSNLGLRASGTTAPLSIGNLTIADGSNVILDTTTGTKIGTATTQKLGFFNATPIVQQANSVSLEAVLSNFGFRASGTAAPISVGVMTATTSANVIAGTSSRAAKIGGAIVDYYTNAANSGTAETDLYSTTLEANILGANGDKLVIRYGIDLPSASGATVNIRMYFGGSAIFGTGALTKLAAGWMDVHVEIIRVSSTTIRYTAFFQNTGYGSVPLVGGAELAGLTLSNTNVIKITGQAGAGGANNDIVAKLGSIKWYPAA